VNKYIRSYYTEYIIDFTLGSISELELSCSLCESTQDELEVCFDATLDDADSFFEFVSNEVSELTTEEIDLLFVLTLFEFVKAPNQKVRGLMFLFK
jgi:hypothetical protein